MKVRSPKSLAFRPPPLFAALLIASLLGFLGLSSPAAIPLTLDNPTAFFTNVAARLLRSELNLDLNNLQVYPTNYYTPSVHRLLQVTANLYDSATNRTLNLTPEYPYCPSVFRPLFRRVVSGTNTIIVIAGYREVTNADMASPSFAPAMLDLSQPSPALQVFPAYGAPFTSPDKIEPMVSGIPLVIGAKKGFPNFNEFSMETEVPVRRLLEFRRGPGDFSGPVIQTNQMYVAGISNSFGLEAWNSYLSAFPRPLRLLASAHITAILTNETGVIFSNTAVQGASLDMDTNTWSGWTNISSVSASMVLPFGNTNSFSFLTNSTYINQPPWFVPLTHSFTSNEGFYVPHWWLNLSTRVQFILVDTAANRIVDYVNLNRTEPTVDITSMLASGNTGSVNPFDYRNQGNQWLTNQLGGISSPDAPTYGVLNQIQVGLNGTTDWLSFVQDPYAGLDSESAVDGYRYNYGFSPIYPKDAGKVFYRSNVFYAPFDPYRTIYVHTSWQANDPLVHFTPDDLGASSFDPTNTVNLLPYSLNNLGRINGRYAPWGGNPYRINPLTDVQMAVKDPGILRPDNWNFPTNQGLSIDWVGRVHRGTPW